MRCFAGLILSLVLPASALAAPPDDKPDATAQAEAVYALGVAFFKDAKYAKALTQFERAYKLDPVPVLMNAADVLAARLTPGATSVGVQVGDDGARSAIAWFVLRPEVVGATLDGAVIKFTIRPQPSATQVVIAEVSAGGQTLKAGDAERVGVGYTFTLPAPPAAAVSLQVMVDGAAAAAVDAT